VPKEAINAPLGHNRAEAIDTDNFRWTVANRRRLHRIPELGFELPRTRATLVAALQLIGADIDPKSYGRSGLLATITGARPGPTFLVRADMDALPIEERSHHAWRSEIAGNSHACGHDGHMAVALSVARSLSESRDRFAGTAVFCFQPSEEPGGGAAAMIADGVLERYSPDRCIGVHLWSELEIGTLAIHDGAVFASSDKLHWEIKGHGGHGAVPHLSQDTVGALASLIDSNSYLVAREVDPREAAVISVGSILGGTAHNIIPSSIKVSGTLRTQSKQTRDRLLKRLTESSRAIAGRFRLEITFDSSGFLPPCRSNPEVTAAVRQVAEEHFGDLCRFEEFSTMASDDMAEFLDRVPGCYFFVGCGNPAKNITAPHHTPEFDIDEDALLLAAEIIAGVILRGDGRQQPQSTNAP